MRACRQAGFFFVVVGCLALALACRAIAPGGTPLAGTGPNLPPQTGSGDAPGAPAPAATSSSAATVSLSPEVRNKALTTIAAYLEEHGSAAARGGASGAMLGVLRALPGIADAGLATDTDSLWARFADGRLILFSGERNLPPVEPPPSGSAEVTARSIQSGQVSPGALPAPSSGRDRFDWVTAFGDLFLVARYNHATFPPLLAENGFVRGDADATVEGLKKVREDGLFVLQTHGGSGVASDGTRMFGLFTADRVPMATGDTPVPQDDAAHRDDWNSGRLAYFWADTDFSRDFFGGYVKEPRTGRLKVKVECHYAITDRFVRQYMRFTRNSLVFVNACSSDNQALKQAFFARGAGGYLGWTLPSNERGAGQLLDYLLDRLLGANRTYSAPALLVRDIFSMPPSPPQRPFSLIALMGALRAADRDHDQAGDASPGQDPGERSYLRFTPDPTDASNTFNYLVPAIEQIHVNETTGILTLRGSFGSSREPDGAVSIANPLPILGYVPALPGTPLPVKTWTSNTIECEIPASVTGYVVVTVRGHRSNPVLLGEWSGKVTAKKTQTYTGCRQTGSPPTPDCTTSLDGNLEQVQSCDVFFRGQANGIRRAPELTPILQPIFFGYSADGSLGGGGFAGKTACKWSTTGTLETYQFYPKTPESPEACDCWRRTTLETDTGAATVKSRCANGVAGPGGSPSSDCYTGHVLLPFDALPAGLPGFGSGPSPGPGKSETPEAFHLETFYPAALERHFKYFAYDSKGNVVMTTEDRMVKDVNFRDGFDSSQVRWKVEFGVVEAGSFTEEDTADGQVARKVVVDWTALQPAPATDFAVAR